MILSYLLQTSQLLEIDDNKPVFVYDRKGMDNYVMDKVPKWSVNVPFLEEDIRFDIFHEKRYNPIIAFHIISEINQSADFYQNKFNLLVSQQRKFLIELDKIKDNSGRRIVTVRSDIVIKTSFIPQTNNFDSITTAIYFNLPLLLNQYGSIC